MNNGLPHSIAGLMALVDAYYFCNGSKEDAKRNRDAIEAYARAAAVVPPEVLAAVDRMCTPISDTRLEPNLRSTGLTGREDARCMQVIRDYLIGNAPQRPDIEQIIYALQRQARALDSQAEALAAQLDYSAELPAEDADRMREAIAILGALTTIPAQATTQGEA